MNELAQEDISVHHKHDLQAQMHSIGNAGTRIPHVAISSSRHSSQAAPELSALAHRPTRLLQCFHMGERVLNTR